MQRRPTAVFILTLAIVSILVLTLPGCNMVKGIGQDITNVAQASENILNGEGARVSDSNSNSNYRR